MHEVVVLLLDELVIIVKVWQFRLRLQRVSLNYPARSETYENQQCTTGRQPRHLL